MNDRHEESAPSMSKPLGMMVKSKRLIVDPIGKMLASVDMFLLHLRTRPRHQSARKAEDLN